MSWTNEKTLLLVEFHLVCERNPELHFLELHEQISIVQADTKRANQWRQLQTVLAHGESGSQSSSGSPNVIGLHKSASSEVFLANIDVKVSFRHLFLNFRLLYLMYWRSVMFM